MTSVALTPEQCAASVIFGIDLGDRFSNYCGIDGPTGEILEEGRLVTNKAAFTRRFSKMDPVVVAIEAGTHSRWISKQLEGYGHTVLVAHPQKVRLICDNDTKNDKLDAMRLAMLARADPRLLHPIRHRSPKAHADLELLKARDLLVQTRTRLVNHVRGVVKGFGGRLSRCDAKVFHRRVAEELPEDLKSALEPLLAQLQALEDSVRHYDALIKGRCEEYPETQRLQQIAGVGPLTSLAFVLTLEDPLRFPRGDNVGSYLGLRPRQQQTGGPTGPNPRLRITKAGNSYLRRLLVSSAHYVLGHYGPDCDLKRWGERLTRRRGKKKAVVGVARKLAVLMHRLWITGEDYEPLRQGHKAPPKRRAPEKEGSIDHETAQAGTTDSTAPDTTKN